LLKEVWDYTALAFFNEVAISSNFPLNYFAKLQYKIILKSILVIIFYDSIINKLILEDKNEVFYRMMN